MVIRAKFAGRCAKCGSPIRVGDEIDWVRGGSTSHIKCQAATTQVVPADAIHIRRGQGYGGTPYQAGTVVRTKDGQYLYVLAANSLYYREDGMSFGVGDERGYVYSAVCRLATDEESAPLRAEIEAQAQAAAKRSRLEQMFASIKKDGEYPEGRHSPEGRQIDLNPRNIYGGGRWIIVASDYVWAITNNGADGDDWSRNNVVTGGAGAIGYRIPTTAELLAELDGGIWGGV